MSHHKSFLALFGLYMFVGITTAVYEVSVAKNCSNYQVHLKEQAYGFDLTNFNTMGPELKGKGYTKPILTLTCEKQVEWNSFTVPDQFTANNFKPISSNKSSSKCFSDVDALQNHIYKEVEIWEKYPLGSFTNTNGNGYFVVPSTARCVISVMNKIIISDAWMNRPALKTNPNLDPEFCEAFNILPDRRESNPGAFADFIKNYGTSFWEYGSFGSGIHVYVLTANEVTNGVGIVDEAIASFRPDAGLNLGDWIKQKFDSAVVLVKHTGTGPWSQDNTNLLEGDHKLLTRLFSKLNKSRTEALEEAITEYLTKAGFKNDWERGWEIKNKK